MLLVILLNESFCYGDAFMKKRAKKDILLIIPAYNEDENLVNVIKKVEESFPQFDYIVVNDGSIDTTKDICEENRFRMIDYSVNLGLKMAFLGGVDYAVKNGYSYVVQYDADGQHNACYIDDMLKCAKTKNVDVVIGSRFLKCGKPVTARMIGSRLISWCIKLSTHKTITDPTSGMRLYNTKAMRVLMHQVCFGPEPDLVAHLLRCGMKVEEIGVTMNERVAGESYLDFIASLKYMFLMISSILLVERFRK